MFLVRRNELPYMELERMFDDMFSASRRESTIPSVNVTENAKSYWIELAVPGVKKEDLTVDLHDGVLSISVEREEKEESKSEDCKKCLVREYNYSSFRRTFGLPEDVDQANIEASYEYGVLRLVLPKHEVDSSEQKRQIEIM